MLDFCVLFIKKKDKEIYILRVKLLLGECFVPAGQGKNLLQQFLQTFCAYGTVFVPDT